MNAVGTEPASNRLPDIETGRGSIAPKPKNRGLLYEMKKNKVLFLMLLPAVIWFIVFAYFPMTGLVLAFKNYNYTDGIFNSPWVGFDNFKFLFVSGAIYRITTNTIVYNFVFIGLGTVTQIAAAVFLSEMTGKYFKKLSQSLMFLPYFISYVLLGAFVYNIFNFEFGSLNTLLKTFNLAPMDAYGTPWIWKYIISCFYLWKWIGYGSIIYLAAIMSINSEYYEAGRMDGATVFQEIRYITLPLIMPTVVILFLFNIGSLLRGQFDLFYQLIGDNGNLFEATDIIDTYVFRALTRSFDIGMGSAVGFYQSVFGLLLVVTVNYIIKKINSDYALF
ncbi:ABC transporter permease subunit [Paenibacillus sp. LMG 31461]|uniref:ABC transporter permease subunit n=1 Tax=Paenibacillus plantarum TaxID=2654975 RepID=A0ABX1XL65_9BACL|nr:ABC transporter permease subunit [Paenibacillus plantarum]NOU68766.1 ABC transporter permease subunit [Paenibacillus plantarum]